MITRTPQIHLIYSTDQWLSNESRKLVYIGEEIEDCLASCVAYKGMTKEQAQMCRERSQSQCTGNEVEWIVEHTFLNAFV